jgi:hypothetical protein
MHRHLNHIPLCSLLHTTAKKPMNGIGFTSVQKSILLESLQFNVMNSIQQYTSTTALATTCHTLYSRRVISMCMLGRSLGVRWHKSVFYRNPCGHHKQDIAQYVQRTHQQSNQPYSVVRNWFDRYGYVTTNRVTHNRSVTLYICVIGGHAVLDCRGRTSNACTDARLARNCRRVFADRIAHVCDLNCHVSGSYIRHADNDVMSMKRTKPGDLFRIVFTRDDLCAGLQCMEMSTVFQFAKNSLCELGFCASSRISHAQNMATLIYVIELGRLAGCWGQLNDRASPLPLMTWNAYVELCTATRAPIVVSSRCIMSGSLHYCKRLWATHLACIKGVSQFVRFVRVRCLVVVGGIFSTVGWNTSHRPLVYQCSEIRVIKCLPRVVGRTSSLDKDETATYHQLCYFHQTILAVPVDIYITTAWKEGLRLIPLQKSTQYSLDICGSVDIHTIPRILIIGAETVKHGGVYVAYSQGTRLLACSQPRITSSFSTNTTTTPLRWL